MHFIFPVLLFILTVFSSLGDSMWFLYIASLRKYFTASFDCPLLKDIYYCFLYINTSHSSVLCHEYIIEAGPLSSLSSPLYIWKA